MKNHESCPTSFTPFLEVNVVTHDYYTNGQTCGHGCSRGHGYGRGCGHGGGVGNPKNTSSQKWKNNEEKHTKEKGGQNTNMLKTCAIVVVVIGLILFIHQNILLIFTKNHLKIKRKR